MAPLCVGQKTMSKLNRKLLECAPQLRGSVVSCFPLIDISHSVISLWNRCPRSKHGPDAVFVTTAGKLRTVRRLLSDAFTSSVVERSDVVDGCIGTASYFPTSVRTYADIT